MPGLHARDDRRSPDTAILWYETHAAERAGHYESLDPASLYGWLLDLLPAPPQTAVDIGAGSGRDAAWLASLGYDVHAVEPCGALRVQIGILHPEACTSCRDDRLPGIASLRDLHGRCGLVLLSAVWMHLSEGERPRAMSSLAELLGPAGLLVLLLRHGAADPTRAIYPAPAEQVIELAAQHGLSVVRRFSAQDQLGRDDVSWTQLLLRNRHAPR